MNGQGTGKIRKSARKRALIRNETGRRSRARGGVIIFFLAVMALAASTGWTADNAMAGEVKNGGTLNVGFNVDIRGFDIMKTRYIGPSGASALNLVEEKLFNLNDDGSLEPVLGLAAEISPDGKTWTVSLRQGVTFHDGTAFNADAVVHHWNRVLSPKRKFKLLLFGDPIDSVERVDAYTVRFHLRLPWAGFKGILSSPRSFESYIPSPKAVEADTQNLAPVGTGPFMYKERNPGSFVVVKNPDYWQKGKPALDRVCFKALPDHQARYAALKAGEVDLIWTDRGNHILDAKKDPSLTVHQDSGSGAETIYLNLSSPPLDNPLVRQALSHGWNQAQYVKMVYRDTIPVTHHLYGEGFGCEEAGYRAYDPEKAKKLLAEYGKPVELEFLHSNTLRGRETGQIVQQLYKKIGVTIKLKSVDILTLFRTVQSSEYQISGYRNMDFPDPDPPLYVVFHSTSPINFMHYKSAEMDRLLDVQRTEADPAARKRALCDIARLINKDAPMLYRGGHTFYSISKSSVKGVGSMKNAIVRVNDVWME